MTRSQHVGSTGDPLRHERNFICPEGYVLVPIEPTSAMLAAGQITHIRAEGYNHAAETWAAMLAARPKEGGE
jgi:hypothetical protein